MDLTRHCTLCQNRITSFEKGVMCKLTKRKPDFKDTCPDIKLGNTFQEKLEDAILELANIRRYKRSAYVSFYLFMVTGVLLIVGSLLFIEWSYTRYIWDTKMTLIGMGILALPTAIYKLNRFKKNYENAKYTKNKIDRVLELYSIFYMHSFDIEEEIHGTRQVTLHLEFKNWTKKTTSTSFMMDSKNNIND